MEFFFVFFKTEFLTVTAHDILFLKWELFLNLTKSADRVQMQTKTSPFLRTSVHFLAKLMNPRARNNTSQNVWCCVSAVLPFHEPSDMAKTTFMALGAFFGCFRAGDAPTV